MNERQLSANVLRISADRLTADFFARDTLDVAHDLIGGQLISYSSDGVTSGRIVETEAYLDAADSASHAAFLQRGKELLAGPPGTIYMYVAMGIHDMFNIVAHLPGESGAVLIRALEPLDGIELMRARRGSDDLRSLCSGPGKLCQSLKLDYSLTGQGVENSPHVILRNGNASPRVERTVRIGISRATDLDYRFVDAGSAYLSRPLRILS